MIPMEYGRCVPMCFLLVQALIPAAVHPSNLVGSLVFSRHPPHDSASALKHPLWQKVVQQSTIHKGGTEGQDGPNGKHHVQRNIL